MSAASKEIVFLILQLFDEQGFKETAHMLERESGFYFDMKYFENMVLEGKWDDVERYLSGFSKVDDNRYSTKIYFELRKQKYLEALDINDRAKATDILMKDLKVFAPGHEELFNEITQLLTMNNIREHESLSKYRDVISVRKTVMDEIKKIVEENPVFDGKLRFPAFRSQRLRHLLNQSLNWQHLLCKDPVQYPVIKTLLEDHVCEPEESNSFVMSEAPLSNNHISSPSTVTDPETAVEVLGNARKRFKRRRFMPSDEVTSSISNDLPKSVLQSLNEDSAPTSMDFHPVWHTVLLVGTHIGNIGLWEVITGKKLFSRNFGVWDIGACSTTFKATLEKEMCISIKKIRWSPDGSLFGVAFSEHVVQLYSYHGGECVGHHLEIDAHDGSINDLAFSPFDQQLLVITCGDDKTIKVWDAITGDKCYSCECHKVPVCSICPHLKGDVLCIFSASVDGKIKAWLHDTPGARVDFDAPSHEYTTLAYSADNQRLLSCGKSTDGEPYLVERDENGGHIKRVYKGLKKPSFSTIQFDSTQNRILAAGDDHMIKFWNMDNDELWTTIDCHGELPENPCIRFNKEGTLLAVATKENKIKILATDYGVSLKFSENALNVLFENLGKNGCNKVSDICKPSQCQFLQLPMHSKGNKIVRLAYTNVGNAILALASNGTHQLWKWPYTSLNLDSKATTRVSPHLWQPTRSGLKSMSNDLTNAKSGDPVSCFTLSKNDAYLISTSGGIISLFNAWTFKTLMTFMPPPPMATCLAICPQDNNILAVGMDNSSILIYNFRTNEVENKLQGHSKRVTALAFSTTLNVLVSGDVNAQILLWNTNGWKKLKDSYMQMQGQEDSEVLSETQIQFHPDQINFLAVHNTHLAIYEARKLRCVNQWVPEVSVAISQAAFSSDGHTVYASFVDGTLAIFGALNFQMHCRIHPSAYLPNASLSMSIYPVAIAAHPQKPNQFAVGHTDGSIYVFEPREPGGDWSMFPVNDKEVATTHG